MNFNTPALVSKYGSWMRVQVAFYDFLFKTASNLCVTHWKQMAIEEISAQFKDGGDLYERTVTKIMELWSTPETAWEAFLNEEL